MYAFCPQTRKKKSSLATASPLLPAYWVKSWSKIVKKTYCLWQWRRQLRAEGCSLLGANLPASPAQMYRSLETQAPNTYCLVVVTIFMRKFSLQSVFVATNILNGFLKVLKIPIVHLPYLKEAKNHLLRYVWHFARRSLKKTINAHGSLWELGRKTLGFPDQSCADPKTLAP